MQTNTSEFKKIPKTNKSLKDINQQKISDMEIYQTYEQLLKYKNLLDNFYKKNLFPNEIYSHLNYSLKTSLDLLEFYRHKILVCGTINSGKTTFINTLLKENILDFSSLENTKWPIIIRNKNKENPYIAKEKSKIFDNKKKSNDQHFTPFKLYSSKLIKSKSLFEFEKNALLAEGKKNIKSYLKDLNNDEYIEDLFKEFQFNFYEKQIKLNQISDFSYVSFMQNSKDSDEYNNIKNLDASVNLNMNESYNFNSEAKNKRKNPLEKSLDEFNKTIDKLENVELIKTNKDKNHKACYAKFNSESNKDKALNKKGDADIKIFFDMNSDKFEKNKLIQKQFLENFVLQNESFVKYLKENDLYEKLINCDEINEKELMQSLENYKKFVKNERQKTKKITSDNINIDLSDDNSLFCPFKFDEKIASFVFILEIDFEELAKEKRGFTSIFFRDKNYENFEIWDIPGLNSDKNHIADIVINNIIKTEDLINKNFNFLNEKRIILLYLSECNNFNQAQNKNIWERLSFLREYTSDNFFILNKIDLFSIEDFKKNNLKNLPKNTFAHSKNKSNLNTFSTQDEIVNLTLHHLKKGYPDNDQFNSDTDNEEEIVFGYLKNFVRNEFHLTNNSYVDKTVNYVNLKTIQNIEKNFILNSSGNLNTNNSQLNNRMGLNTTGNLDAYTANKYRNYFFQSDNTSVFLISSLYSFLENCETEGNLNEDYWDLKKSIFETNAFLLKEFKSFSNFKKHYESKLLEKDNNNVIASHEEDSKTEFKETPNRKDKINNSSDIVYLSKFEELIFDVQFAICKKSFFSKICSNCKEFIYSVVYGDPSISKNFELSGFSPRNNVDNSNWNNCNDTQFIENSNNKANPCFLERYNSERNFNKGYQNLINSENSNSGKKRKSEELNNINQFELQNYVSESSIREPGYFRNRAYSGDFITASINRDIDFQYFKNITKEFNMFGKNNNSYFSSSEIMLSYTKKIFEFYLKNLDTFVRELTANYKETLSLSFEKFKKDMDSFIDDIIVFRQSKTLEAGELYRSFINNLIKLKSEYKRKLDNFKSFFRNKVLSELENLNKNANRNNNNNNLSNSKELNGTSKMTIKYSIINFFLKKIVINDINESIGKIENHFNYKVSRIVFDISLGLSSGLVNGILAFCGTNLIQTILNSKLVFFSSVAFCFTIGIGCLVFFSFKEIRNLNASNKQTFMDRNEKMMKFVNNYVIESLNYLDLTSKKVSKNVKSSIIKINGFIDYLKYLLN